MSKSLNKLEQRIRSAFKDCLLPLDSIGDYSNIQPWLALAPHSEQQVSELLQMCQGGEVMIVPVGANHQIADFRNDGDDRPVVAVSTQNLKQIIGYSQEDLTMTAQSGVLLSELNEIAATFEQHLPIDPPHADSVTLGGMVACNTYGPRRVIHGSIVDYVLGGSMVLPNGTLVKSGAHTIKNVAGYDLHKLLVGSYGSLGIITRLSLKLKPLPESFRIAVMGLEDSQEVDYVVRQIVRDRTRPSLVIALNAIAAQGMGHDLEEPEVLLCVGFEGLRETVEWQMQQVCVTLGEDNVMLLDTEESIARHALLANWSLRDSDYTYEVASLSRQCRDLFDWSTEHGLAVMSYVANGIVIGSAFGEPDPSLGEVLDRFVGKTGSTRFLKLPPNSRVSSWGRMDQQRLWMRAVKEKFDPKRILPWPGFLGMPD